MYGECTIISTSMYDYQHQLQHQQADWSSSHCTKLLDKLCWPVLCSGCSVTCCPGLCCTALYCTLPYCAVLCSVDLVLVGAEGVVENGGVINKLGTYQIALCAKALNKPFYVAAESYKFARLYPLNQQVSVISVQFAPI